MSYFNAVILGGSSGFGKSITYELLKTKRFNITILGLNKPKNTNPRLRFLKCNLSKIKQLKNCINTVKKEIDPIDVLILNSGSFYLKKEIICKKYEKTFFVNFLSQFYLILCLKKKILNSKIRKVIVISSHVIIKNQININDIQSLTNFNFWKSYKNSKSLLYILCKNLFLKEKKKINYIFFNPGRIQTNLGSTLKIIGNLINLYHKFFGKKPGDVSKIFIQYLIKNLNLHRIFKLINFNKKKVQINNIINNKDKINLEKYVYDLSKNI